MFAGLAGGLGQLPHAAGRGLDVRTGTTVRELARSADGGWNVVVGPTTAPEVLQADAVVVATPGAAAARGCSPARCPTRRWSSRAIEYASMAVVTLAFPAAAFPAVDRLGLPGAAGRRPAVKAATYSFAKWDWVDAASTTDLLLLRTSIGRHREEQQLQASTRSWSHGPWPTSAPRSGLPPGPSTATCSGGAAGLPQYAVGHLEPGPPDPRGGRRRRRAGGLRSGVRRAGDAGLHRLRRGGRRAGPRRSCRSPGAPAGPVTASGRMEP